MLPRKPALRGLRRGEELLLDVACSIVDSFGTSLPPTGTPVVVGVSDQRLLVWSVPAVAWRSGKLLGGVARSRVAGAVIEGHGSRTEVRFTFDADARLAVDAPRERHPEQLAWALSAKAQRAEQ